jgi:hypothetical protein
MAGRCVGLRKTCGLVAIVIFGCSLAGSDAASASVLHHYRWPEVRRLVPMQVLHKRALRRHALSPRARATIVGGSQIAITQAPWQAEVFAEFESGKGVECGAAILDSTHVITAAHCTFDLETGKRLAPGAFVVVAGTASITAEEIKTTRRYRQSLSRPCVCILASNMPWGRAVRTTSPFSR